MDTQAAEPSPIRQGQRLHLQALKRRFVVSQSSVHATTLASRVTACLFPWSVETYPGIKRGVLAVLGNRVTWRVVQFWQAEGRPIPPWARAILADYLRSRAAVALELAAELDALPVRPDKRRAGNREGPNQV